MIDQLREISRQHYLQKREEKELKLLELSVKDEQYLFDDVEVTAEERERMELNKKILNMAKDRYRFDYKDDGNRKIHIPASLLFYFCTDNGRGNSFLYPDLQGITSQTAMKTQTAR